MKNETNPYEEVVSGYSKIPYILIPTDEETRQRSDNSQARTFYISSAQINKKLKINARLKESSDGMQVPGEYATVMYFRRYMYSADNNPYLFFVDIYDSPMHLPHLSNFSINEFMYGEFQKTMITYSSDINCIQTNLNDTLNIYSVYNYNYSNEVKIAQVNAIINKSNVCSVAQSEKPAIFSPTIDRTNGKFKRYESLIKSEFTDNIIDFYNDFFVGEDGIFLYKIFDDDKNQEIEITQLCNFTISKLFTRRRIYSKEFAELYVYLDIKVQNGSVQVSVKSTEMDKIIYEIQKQCPFFFLSPEIPKVVKRFSACISQMLNYTTCEDILCRTGWHEIADNKHFYADDAMIGNNGICCSSGKAIRYYKDFPIELSFFHVMRMLMISADMSKTLPLLLFSHIGVMYTLFEEAGFKPRFLMFLCGSTGSLKTSVSKVFFQFLSNGNNDLTATFNDTLAALEAKMGESKDDVMLVDDFRPSVLRSEHTRMKANLEALIRYFGDSVGKDRVNPNLELREKKSPHSACAITGEIVEGIESSLKRLVIINVRKGTYNTDLLKFYQDNPRYLSTHMRYFILYLREHYSEIVEFISTEIPKARSRYTSIITFRLADAAAILDVTAQIIIKYATYYYLVYPYTIEKQLKIWQDLIFDVIFQSDKLSVSLEPIDMIINGICECIKRRKAVIADNKSEYSKNMAAYIGFYDDKKKEMYLDPTAIYRIVGEYWRDMGRPFVITETKFRKEMANRGYIYTQGANYTVVLRCLKQSQPSEEEKKFDRMLKLDISMIEKDYEFNVKSLYKKKSN